MNRLMKIIRSIDVADSSELVVVQLEEAWVEDVVALLEKLAPEQIGKGAKGPNTVYVVANAHNNSLVLRGDPRTLVKMQVLIQRLDTPSDSHGTTQVIRLAHADAKSLAEILKSLGNPEAPQGAENASPAGKTNIQADESLNALVIMAEPTVMHNLKQVIDTLDVRRDQVMIEAAIVEVSEDFTQELGSELAAVDRSGTGVPLMLTAPSGTLASILASLASGGAVNPGAVNPGTSPILAAGRENRDGTSFAVILRALARNSDVDLLSTPSIMTLDNQEAKIVVGQNVPFRTGSTVTGSDGATNPFTTIERQDVGLTLQVTPHVHDGNLVRLEVHQEVSEVDQSGSQVIGSSGSADLITNKRTIDTTILVDDAEVIILGGLIRDKTTRSETKVPVLGSIPVMGRLFKSTSSVREKSNLLVFLRPTVLRSRDDITAVTERKYRNVWDLEIKGVDPAAAMRDILNGKRPGP
jgi:general secretion pathway protein D